MGALGGSWVSLGREAAACDSPWDLVCTPAIHGLPHFSCSGAAGSHLFVNKQGCLCSYLSGAALLTARGR